MANKLEQGLLYPIRYIRGRRKSSVTLESIKNGTGGVIDLDGQKVAIYKDESGKVFSYTAVCQHLGCIIGWDDLNKRWECPCHGSRYDTQGRMLRGPTKKDLPLINIS